MIEEFLSSKWYADYRALVQKNDIAEFEEEMLDESSKWLQNRMAMHELDAASSTARIRRLRDKRDTAKNRAQIRFAIEQKIRHVMMAERIRQELAQRKTEKGHEATVEITAEPQPHIPGSVAAPPVPPSPPNLPWPRNGGAR